MRTDPSRVRAGAAAGVLEGVRIRKGSVARVLQAAGLSSLELEDPDRFIELARLVLLFHHAAEDTGDESFGLRVGANFDLGALGALSYTVLHAPTVGTGLRNLHRYARTHVRGAELSVVTNADTASLQYGIDVLDSSLRRQNVEAVATTGVQLMQVLVGQHWRPSSVLFQHSRPRSLKEHRRILRSRVRFDQPVNALCFDARDLSLAVPHADLQLLPIVEEHLSSALEAADDAQGRGCTTYAPSSPAHSATVTQPPGRLRNRWV